MAKKKSLWIGIGIVVVVIIAVYSWGKGIYNNLVSGDEQVKTAWSQVENQYQRRADLIPNLVNTVKGYAAHERETLEAVIRARADATSTTVNAGDLDAAQLQKFQAAQGELSNALSRLMVVVERYPDLKANQNFLELQAQLEGTENRIAVERMRFNETAQQYNTYLRRFPNVFFAGLFGFEQKPYFAADAGAERAPSVDFGTTSPAPGQIPPLTAPSPTPAPVTPSPESLAPASPAAPIAPSPAEPVTSSPGAGQ